MLSKVNQWKTVQQEKSSPAHPSAMNTLARAFTDLIAADEPAERSVKFYAKKLTVSENYLSVAVKKETGLTVMEWINKRTLNETIVLLVNTTLTLADIAARVGLSSASHLSRFFKQQMGCTPDSFRTEYKRQQSISTLPLM